MAPGKLPKTRILLVEAIVCKAPLLCAAVLSAAAMSTAAIAQPLYTSQTYGHQTVVYGPKGHDRIYSTYGNQTYGPHGGLSSYTNGTTTYYEHKRTTAETFGNQTVVRHSNGKTTVCYNAVNQSYCN